jgi:hypothetical protein
MQSASTYSVTLITSPDVAGTWCRSAILRMLTLASSDAGYGRLPASLPPGCVAGYDLPVGPRALTMGTHCTTQHPGCHVRRWRV